MSETQKKAAQKNGGVSDMMLETMVPSIVRRMATWAIQHGCDSDDSTGAIKALCIENGLDVFGWYLIRREVGDLQHKAHKIGFVG